MNNGTLGLRAYIPKEKRLPKDFKKDTPQKSNGMAQLAPRKPSDASKEISH